MKNKAKHKQKEATDNQKKGTIPKPSREVSANSIIKRKSVAPLPFKPSTCESIKKAGKKIMKSDNR